MIALLVLQLDVEKTTGFEEYKGKCQPVFLFYKVCVNVSICVVHSCFGWHASENECNSQYIHCGFFMIVQDGKVLEKVMGVQAPILSSHIATLCA